MKKVAIILAIIIAVLLAAVLLIPAKRSVAPVNPTPTTSQNGSLVVSSPLPNTVIASPLVVEGKARGTWYFEASFPVSVLDGDGTVLGIVPAQAQGDPAGGEVNWMTTDFVPFKASIPFKTPKSTEGTLLLHNDNPSGLPEHDASMTIPIRFAPVQATEPTAPPSSCKPTGCSGEICSDKEVTSICIYNAAYACYKAAACERQASGECGWTETAELQSCLGQ